MEKLLDTLASGIHDARNQLLIAESQLAERESRHGIDLGEARQAIENAAGRLTRLLTAYRLMQHDARLALQPCRIDELCAEAALTQRSPFAARGLELTVDCQVLDEWVCARDLVADMLNNALQNACRHARQRVRLSARTNADGLQLCVEDDGPGFSELPPQTTGSGLLLAGRLAELHRRSERHGHLQLSNGGRLGGAVFTLTLP
ncbi:HAMP domain-containing sensor histidine kinase [Dechloromonas sp. ZY10]|uniref:sensor histidine kinase n=1 Tax=Dechloromonas aquae TaxID=2664436 RepID=UPI003528A0BF